MEESDASGSSYLYDHEETDNETFEIERKARSSRHAEEMKEALTQHVFKDGGEECLEHLKKFIHQTNKIDLFLDGSSQAVNQLRIDSTTGITENQSNYKVVADFAIDCIPSLALPAEIQSSKNLGMKFALKVILPEILRFTVKKMFPALDDQKISAAVIYGLDYLNPPQEKKKKRIMKVVPEQLPYAKKSKPNETPRCASTSSSKTLYSTRDTENFHLQDNPIDKSIGERRFQQRYHASLKRSFSSSKDICSSPLSEIQRNFTPNSNKGKSKVRKFFTKQVYCCRLPSILNELPPPSSKDIEEDERNGLGLKTVNFPEDGDWKSVEKAFFESFNPLSKAKGYSIYTFDGRPNRLQILHESVKDARYYQHIPGKIYIIPNQDILKGKTSAPTPKEQCGICEIFLPRGSLRHHLLTHLPNEKQDETREDSKELTGSSSNDTVFLE